MSMLQKVSIVLPVRNGQDRVTARVERLLESIADLTPAIAEVLCVDDGSQDATVEALDDLRGRYPQVRIIRHGRPRGMEAAGQSGLERASSEVVFIQETDSDVRIEDLRRLLVMCEDETIIAARAESTPAPVPAAITRRLRAWGTSADRQIEARADSKPTSLQMVRRPHLQTLAGPRGHHYRLRGETVATTTTH